MLKDENKKVVALVAGTRPEVIKMSPVYFALRESETLRRVILSTAQHRQMLDQAFAPFGISHGQYSLLMSLNRPDAPRLGEAAAFLAMDRTTLTANLKPLERRGLISIVPDADDRRSRRLHLTDAGRDLLKAAVPVWRSTHDEVDTALATNGKSLRSELRRVAAAY